MEMQKDYEAMAAQARDYDPDDVYGYYAADFAAADARAEESARIAAEQAQLADAEESAWALVERLR